MRKAVNISVIGRVQGVGFRPFLYSLATELNLKGTVQNNMDGVAAFIEGNEAQIQLFVQKIKQDAPRLARVDEMVVQPATPKGLMDFRIIESKREGTSQLVIPVDASICEDCLQEMKDPENSRYRYPFITCTQCGPRYTIIDALPYDRPFTSMKDFPLCPTCKKEYNDPLNRRHHAQPIACSNCGPQLTLVRNDGTLVASHDEALKLAGELILQGKVLAVKGIGGFHLCCDAQNDEAVKILRERKNRPNRPLAVMSPSIEAIKEFATISVEEEKLLKSPEAPIVVLAKNAANSLAENVAPNMTTIGVMLPYSPLHVLLIEEANNHTLVMTSANVSGLPIVYNNDDCLNSMSTVADYFLMHNRPILHPVDDSVVQVVKGQLDFFRRSRGYVPDPIFTNKNVNGIVAFGGQQKTTFTIGRNEQVFIGPHIGDLENVNTTQHYEHELRHLLKWVEPQLEIGVIDFHPNYETREIVKEFPFQKVVEVQHHHAHMAACLADNDLDEEAFAIILDGTGYGLDGNIWGFEVFYGDCREFNRLAHLDYSPLPGGEACIREPWRNAVGMLYSFFGEEGKRMSETLFPHQMQGISVLCTLIDKAVNTVYAGTCGRLFDAVSSILGLCEKSTYDGEAAIRLSEFSNEKLQKKVYSYSIKEENNQLIFDFRNMLLEIIEDKLNNRDVVEISTAFHETIVQALVGGMKRLLEKNPTFNKKVVLSGGSFHNRYIKIRLIDCLKEIGLEIYTHRRVPCNDGGLSYGQLMVAAAKREDSTCV